MLINQFKSDAYQDLIALENQEYGFGGKMAFRIFGVSLIVALVIGASGLYYMEKDVNPKLDTIPDAMWWSVVTVSTVGYGDVVPITWGGKILAGIMMFMGLGVIAIFTAIVTKMFIDHFFGKRNHTCHYCHYPRHDFDAKFCKNCGNRLDDRKETLRDS